MKLITIIWTTFLFLNIINYTTGGESSWVSVFCPTIYLVVDSWLNVIAEKYFEEKEDNED